MRSIIRPGIDDEISYYFRPVPLKRKMPISRTGKACWALPPPTRTITAAKTEAKKRYWNTYNNPNLT